MKRPNNARWAQIPFSQVGTEAWRCGLTTVLVDVAVGGTEDHVSASTNGKQPTDEVMKMVRLDFDMVDAVEDSSHAVGVARHLWLPGKL